MLFEPYFEHSFEIDKSCVRVAKLAVSEEKVLTLRTKYPLYLVFAVIISTVGSYQTRVLLQQFLKTTFDFSSMWQLWIYNLDIDALLATNWRFFSMLLRVWMHEEKHSTP